MFQRLSIGSILALFSLGSTHGEPVVWLRHGPFDPLTDVQAVEQGLTANESVELYIVQFDGGAFEPLKLQITELGAKVYTYLPDNSYVVLMNASVKALVGALPYVHWVGQVHPAYRLEGFIRANLDDPNGPLYPSHRYYVLVFQPNQKQLIVDRIATIGGVVENAGAGLMLLEATLTPDQLRTVAYWNEVHFIDRWSPWGVFMDNVRAIDLIGGRLAGARMTGGSSSADRVYLGTYVFVASTDVSGTFEIAIDDGDGTLLRNASGQALGVICNQTVAVTLP